MSDGLHICDELHEDIDAFPTSACNPPDSGVPVQTASSRSEVAYILMIKCAGAGT